MSEKNIIWDFSIIQKYNYAGLRYTSYPTILEFNHYYILIIILLLLPIAILIDFYLFMYIFCFVINCVIFLAVISL